MVRGGMLEENFVSAMIGSEGRLVVSFEQPVAGALGALTPLVRLSPLALAWWRRKRLRKPGAA